MNLIVDDLATKPLHDLANRLVNRKDLHERMGAGAAALVKQHFLARNQEPNKKGWPKTGFFGTEGFKKTRLESADAAGATVTVASKPMAKRYHGGTITGKPWLGIPLHAGVYGSYARKFIESRGGMEGSGLFFRRSGAGRLFLGERTVGGRLSLHFLFVRRVNLRADATVLPNENDLRTTVSQEAEQYLREVLP
jgi:hypothetical protein